MGTTLNQLLGRIRLQLSGLGAVEDIQTELAADLDDTSTTITVDDASGFSAGVAEIDLELVRVKTADGSAGVLQLPAYGRGYKGSLSTAHLTGAEVSFSPLWPKSVIADAINGVVTELYPDLYAIGTLDTTVPNDGPVTVPDAVGVISVWLEPYSEPGTWVRMDRWDYQPDADNALILGLGTTGQGVRVVYAKRPVPFDLTGSAPLSQDFATVTGFSDRVSDIVALGVASRLAPMINLGRTVVAGAESRAESSNHPADYTGYTAKLLYSEFRARVQAEQAVLVKEHPIRLHKVAR